MRLKFEEECITVKHNIPYRTKFRRTKCFVGKNVSSEKFSTPSRSFENCIRFLPDICIEILDKIFDGQIFRRKKFSTPSGNFDEFLSDKVHSTIQPV